MPCLTRHTFFNAVSTNNGIIFVIFVRTFFLDICYFLCYLFNGGAYKMLKEKKTKRLEIRLTEDEFNLIRICALTIGHTPSSYLRMFIDSSIIQLQIKIKKGEVNLEDYSQYLNDQL